VVPVPHTRYNSTRDSTRRCCNRIAPRLLYWRDVAIIPLLVTEYACYFISYNFEMFLYSFCFYILNYVIAACCKPKVRSKLDEVRNWYRHICTSYPAIVFDYFNYCDHSSLTDNMLSALKSC